MKWMKWDGREEMYTECEGKKKKVRHREKNNHSNIFLMKKWYFTSTQVTNAWKPGKLLTLDVCVTWF